MNTLIKYLTQIRKPGIIFFAHGVTRKKNDNFIEFLHHNYEDFLEIIEYYEHLGFEFVSMDQVIEISTKQFEYPRPWIHLSFDDGYQNNYEQIYPFFKKKNIPWSMFVSTHHIENGIRFYTYRIRCAILNTTKSFLLPQYGLRLSAGASRSVREAFYSRVSRVFKEFNKTEIRQFMPYIDALLTDEEWNHYNQLYQSDAVLSREAFNQLAADPLVHLGSHCHEHIIFNKKVREKEIVEEMEISKTWLESNLNHNHLTFCYPNGKESDFSPLTREICQKTGYSLAFTTIYRIISPQVDPFEVPRVGLPANVKEAQRQLLSLLIPASAKRVLKKLY